MTVITLPHKFKPREYQLPFFRAMDAGCKRAVLVDHRRAGKDKSAFNFVVKEAFKRVGVYYYFFPTYNQGRKILWDGIDKDGFKFLDHIPKQIRDGDPNSTEMKIRLTNGSLIQIVGSDNIDCYDSETEILTDSGWVFFKDLPETAVVASLVNGEMRFVPIKAKVEHDYVGEMVRVSSKATDLLVTPNHRFWVRSKQGEYKFRKATELSVFGDTIPSTCEWVGCSPDRFSLPGIAPVHYICGKGRKGVVEWKTSFDVSDWCAFLGIFVAEGSTSSPGDGNYRVHITQKKPENVEKIRDLLARMGLTANYNGHSFTVHHKQLWEYCRQLGKAPEKHIPHNIKELSKKHLEILMDWMILGDGSRGMVTTYYSTSKRLIDDFQEIALKCGYSANISVKPQVVSMLADGRQIIPRRTLYQSVLRSSKFRTLGKTGQSYISKELYAGKVYCVDVGGGVVMVRRNGKAVWCGNSIVGTNPVGTVFSEYPLQDPKGWEFVRPILRENGGWAVFPYTPRGKNHGYDLYEVARNNPEWYCERLTIDDTYGKGAMVGPEDIQAERDAGMSENLIQQEYYCSFDAAVEYAVFGEQVFKAREEGRVCRVPHDSRIPVMCYWDIGRDGTAIWFIQTVRSEVRVIDYYHAYQSDITTDLTNLRNKPYLYETMWFPHDGDYKNYSTGKTPKEIATELGFNVEIVPRLDKQSQITAARVFFARCWFDEEKTKAGFDALSSWHFGYDTKLRINSAVPTHDWASHAGDAFCQVAISHEDEAVWKKEDRYSQKPRRKTSWMSA